MSVDRNWFVNQERTQLVREALEGAVLSRADELELLREWQVVVCRGSQPEHNSSRRRIGIVSGGGSGHEPAHVGFVGRGILSGAVCGDVFASPSIAQISVAIDQVTGPEGVILIVKNYTGDRLNFGLAAERARVAGIDCHMVIVGDDIAIAGSRNPRGLAGTLFIHKLAGYLVDHQKHLSIQSVRDFCQQTADSCIFSIGASLGECSLPGKSRNAHRIGQNMVELGMGIHGEPGAEKIAFSSVHELVQLMCEKLTIAAGSTGKLAVIVNNLGGSNGLELSTITREILQNSAFGSRVELIMTGALMTSLDGHGFSISICLLNHEWIVAAMSSPVSPTCAWTGMQRVRPLSELIKLVEAPPAVSSVPQSLPGVSGEHLCRLVKAACTKLIAESAHLDALDASIGDGDTGTTLKGGAERVLAKLDDKLSAQEIVQIIASTCESMGGSSGVILAIFFTAVSKMLATGSDAKDALRAGLDRVSFYSGAKPGDRTMVDAISPAIDALPNLQNAAIAARKAANDTANLTSGLGRVAYLNPQDLLGHADPGAVAVALVLEAMRETESH